jgi:23S rRNA (uracil1939-C5)-methyltransferase
MVVAPARVTIHAVGHGGEGIGRDLREGADTRVWFVDGGLPGDLLLAEPRQVKARMIRGHLEAVLQASPLRQEPPCALAGTCGGCGWQHVRPEAQAGLKAQIVSDLARKLGVAVGTIVASEAALGYRRRARLHFELGRAGLQLGFFGRGGHAVVDAPDCPILDAPLRHALARFRGLESALPMRGELHGLSDGRRAILGVAAQAEVGGHLVTMPPLIGEDAPLRERLAGLLDEVLVGVVIAGPRSELGVGLATLELDAAGPEDMSVRTGPFGFAQAQAAQNSALVEHVMRWADGEPGRRGLELFAGAGNFTRGLSRRLNHLLAVETDARAVLGLQQLAARIGVQGGTRVVVQREPAAAALARAAAAHERFDLVLLDPPRAGLGVGASHDLARVARGRTIYVACDPATMMRDLAVLTADGHRIIDLAIVDMMPMTPEVEVVAVLEAGGAA